MLMKIGEDGEHQLPDHLNSTQEDMSLTKSMRMSTSIKESQLNKSEP